MVAAVIRAVSGEDEDEAFCLQSALTLNSSPQSLILLRGGRGESIGIAPFELPRVSSRA